MTKAEFISLIQKGIEKPEDNLLFQAIIQNTLTILGLSDISLSELLKTSVPTIRRWQDGTSSPHILIKGAVYRTILKLDFFKNP